MLPTLDFCTLFRNYVQDAVLLKPALAIFADGLRVTLSEDLQELLRILSQDLRPLKMAGASLDAGTAHVISKMIGDAQQELR